MVKIWPGDLNLWPWKSIGFQILLRTKFGQNPLKDVDSRVFTRMSHGKNVTQWPWKSIGFQIFLRTNYVPSLVKIHWRMLILEYSQGCHMVKIWPWKSIGFQILLRTKYVPSLVKIHWRILILECSQGSYERTEGSVTISPRNFAGKGIINIRYSYSQVQITKAQYKIVW